MYKRIIILLVLSFVAFSCESFKKKDYSEHEKQMQEAVAKGKNEIEQAKQNAITSVSSEIDRRITMTLENADDSLAGTIKSAQKSIQEEVQKSTQEALDSKLDEIHNEIGSARRVGIIGGLIGFLGLLIGVVCLILSSRKRVEEITKDAVVNNNRVKDKIYNIATKAINETHPSSSQMSSISKDDIQRAVSLFLRSPDGIKVITSQVATPSKASTDDAREKVPSSAPAVAPAPSTTYLFARNSTTKTLSGVGNSYDTGKTLYRIILEKPDANVGMIEPCLDYDDVKRRVLMYGEELLTPICRVTRKASDIKEVIVIEKGRVEKIGASDWRVSKEIDIEFR